MSPVRGALHSTSGSKEFVRQNRARRQALFVDILSDRGERRAVRLEPIGPEILAEHIPGLLDVTEEPGQRDAQRVGVVKSADREVAGLPERRVEAPGGPGMGAMDILPQHHDMHDREYAGAPVIVLFDALVVGEEPGDARRAIKEHRRNIDREEGIEPAGLEHGFERFAGGEEIELHVARQIERDQRAFGGLVEPAHEPLMSEGATAVIMLQHAFDEDDGGCAILRRADAPALEILGAFDAGIGAHVDAGMAEDFRQRDGDRDERAGATALEAHIGGERQFADVEFPAFEHARKDLARPQNLDLEVDSFRLDAAVDERPRPIGVPAGEGESELGHCKSYRSTFDPRDDSTASVGLDGNRRGLLRPCGGGMEPGSIAPSLFLVPASLW